MSKAMNQYTAGGISSAAFLAAASYYLNMTGIGLVASSMIYAGVFAAAMVIFLTTQSLFRYVFVDLESSRLLPDNTTATDKPAVQNTQSQQNDVDLSQELTVSHTQIYIDLNKICKATGWYNHCGLNSLTHFMFAKLSKIPLNELDSFIKENPEYDALLTTFQSYYELPNKPSLQSVLQLLADHVPTDREGIFAPVLRSHMGAVLPRFANDLFETKFAAAVSDCMAGRIRDIAAAVYEPNKEFFTQFKVDYDREMLRDVTDDELNAARTLLEEYKRNDPENNKGDITAVKVRQTVLLTREQNMRPLAKDYWLKQGCQNYANYVADLKNEEMISADQLGWFTERFNIGLEVYTRDSIQKALKDPETAEHTHGMQSVPEGVFKWSMRVYNSGAHWTVEEPDGDQSKADAHNKHYPASFTRSYGNDEKLSGKFKIYGGNSVAISKIKETVRACMTTQVLPQLTAPVTPQLNLLQSAATAGVVPVVESKPASKKVVKCKTHSH